MIFSPPSAREARGGEGSGVVATARLILITLILTPAADTVPRAYQPPRET